MKCVVGLQNENFRREFKAALPCCFSKVERVNEATLTRMGSQYRPTAVNGDSAFDVRDAILADTRSVVSTDIHERTKAYADNSNGLLASSPVNGHEQIRPLLASYRDPAETNF
jgi:hypothetical protein